MRIALYTTTPTWSRLFATGLCATTFIFAILWAATGVFGAEDTEKHPCQELKTKANPKILAYCDCGSNKSIAERIYFLPRMYCDGTKKGGTCVLSNKRRIAVLPRFRPNCQTEWTDLPVEYETDWTSGSWIPNN